MRQPSDPRLTNQENYLKGVTLVWREYLPSNPKNDHDHCAFCWVTFMRDNNSVPDAQTSGYSTTDRYHWVCKGCFEDFRDLFQWKVERVA